MVEFFINFLMLYAIFSTVSMLPISDFFPFGATAGDTVIIDREQGIRLTSYDDGILRITTPRIPFLKPVNNTAVQISTNGYIAFRNITYSQHVSQEFPLSVTLIAPFWDDLKFVKTSAKFYYQLHKRGNALEKASQEILLRKGVAFYPHFVLVVTWFKTNIHGQNNATLTFQLALACDSTETYAFFLYNQLDNFSGRRVSVGWNDGSIHPTFFKHSLHRLLNVSRLVNTSNVGVNGKWMYRVSMLPTSDFFPFGATAGDTVIIDREQGIQLTSTDDGILRITTPRIPFLKPLNNTAVQISTNGYIAFRNITYNIYSSRDFPLSVALIAPFWDDLNFLKTSSKFYYQLHKRGSALEKASQELLRRKGVAFYPHFVLVVTWFKTTSHNENDATLTFQLALACDSTETYAFFLYNQLDNFSRRTVSVGWNDGSTRPTFFKLPLHRMANVSKLVNTSNVGVNGTWMYRIGKPGGEITLCDFEENTCDFVLGDRWSRHYGSTPSSGTGPNVDASGSSSKYYIYYEASGGIANFRSPVYILVSNCNLHRAGCLQFSYHMDGSHMGSLLVVLSNRYLTQTIWSRHGVKGNQWDTASVSLDHFLSRSFSSVFNLTFVAVRGNGYQSDIALDDISITFGSSCTSGSFSCDFEIDGCGITGHNWYRHSGETASTNTGPSVDASGNSLNYYAYYEATGGISNSENSIFIYLSPTSSSIGCLQFSYHMHGADMGSLLVFVSSGSYSELLWSRSGNVGNKWKMASVSFNKLLSRYQPDYGNILFKFVAVRGNGYRSDIALDDIFITFGSNCSSGESFSFCNFEVDTCGFTGSNWNRGSGSTSSQFTGPSVDASGRSAGYYYRFNASASASFSSHSVSVQVSNPLKYSIGCLKFAYHIDGRDNEKLAVRLISRYTETTVWEEISQGNLWKRATVSLQQILNPTVPSHFTVTFLATKGLYVYINIAIDEVAISYGSYCTTSLTTTTTTPTLTTTPFITHHTTATSTTTTSTATTSTNMTPGTISLCNFEENTCGFVLSESWFRNRGSTRSSTTGPNVDASGSSLKYYIYYEATGGIANSRNSIFILLSNCNLSITGCLQFSYNMYGANMGSLLILLSNRYLTRTIWSRHGDKGNQWHTASVSLSPFLSNYYSSVLNLTFVAVRGYDFKSDIALDDIFISFGSDCISGPWSNWGAYDACSETCQSNVYAAPHQIRRRMCNGATFGTTCSGSSTERRLCNVRVICPGSITQWSQWGVCSENCQSNTNVAPTRSRTRQCVGATFGGNCGGASLTMTGTCNVGVGCAGQWSNWGVYGTCSRTCQSNANTVPTQTRRRTCNGGTFGTTCPGNSVETRSCNVGVTCPGHWSNWGAYDRCSETCQSNVNAAPTQARRRTCNGDTLGATCPGSSVDTRLCNIRIGCPGTLSTWGQWGTCSESCQSNLNVVPTRSRTRHCPGATFGANCGADSLTEQGNCNVGVGCQGQWSNWGTYEKCSETCQSNVNAVPIQARRRTCNGGTFGATCNGSSIDTRNCSVQVACPGYLTQWSAYSTCSSTCQPASHAPTQQRTRTCVGATFEGNCNNASLNETLYCNLNIACPGTLSAWEQWSACSESCQSNLNIAPARLRTRKCSGATFSGNCGGASLSENGKCNVRVSCADGDKDSQQADNDNNGKSNQIIMIVVGISIATILILILIVVIILKCRGNSTAGKQQRTENDNDNPACATRRQHRREFDNSNAYDNVVRPPIPQDVPPNIYTELTQVREGFHNYEDIDTYQKKTHVFSDSRF